MEPSLRILMEGLIDYAGLFPPASLEMPAAVRNYAAYLESAHSPWLGRFVVPVSRLAEFSRALAGAETGSGRSSGAAAAGRPWSLSALVGKDFAGDLGAVAAFNLGGREAGDGPADGPGLPAVIDAVEMKAEREEEIRAAMEKAPAGVTAYFEIPIHADPGPLVAAIARAGGRAKVRTGGVTSDLIPAPADLARFLLACARARVPFKATAGLHHPVRSVRPLTYEPGGPEGRMHGFLNVFLAAAYAADGMDAESLAALLEEESPGAISFRGDTVAWRGFRLEGARLTAARRDFAIAFGSCSFDEPRDDLKEAGLL